MMILDWIYVQCKWIDISGIGYEIALNIAKRAARVIIACRDKAKASIAVEKLRSESKNEQIYFRILDISDQSSIRKFVDELSTSDHQIDILINNVGCIGMCDVVHHVFQSWFVMYVDILILQFFETLLFI